MHYRRHFILKDVFKISGNYAEDLGLSGENINNLMQKYDIITPFFVNIKNKTFLEAIGKDYCTLGSGKIQQAIRVALDVIKEQKPSDYEQVKSILDGYSTGSFCNMFITKKEIFFEYCNWIFPILFETDKRIGRNYEPGQERCMGWLAEMLTSIFIYMKSQNIPHKEVFIFDNSINKKYSKFKILKYRLKLLLGNKKRKTKNFIYNGLLHNEYCKGEII